MDQAEEVKVKTFTTEDHRGRTEDHRSLIGRRIRAVRDSGDLNFRLISIGIDINSDQIFGIVGDDGAMVRLRGGDHRVGEFRFVERGDSIQRVTGFKACGYSVHASEVGDLRASVQYLRARIDFYAYVTSGFLWVFGALHGAKGSFDSDVVAVLVDASVVGYAQTDEGNGGYTQHANQDDRSNDDQDDF